MALAVGVAALPVRALPVLDHRHKRHVEFDAWFCPKGLPSACTDFDEIAYEAHWERKESVCRVTFFALGAAALGLSVVGVPRSHG